MPEPAPAQRPHVAPASPKATPAAHFGGSGPPVDEDMMPARVAAPSESEASGDEEEPGAASAAADVAEAPQDGDASQGGCAASSLAPAPGGRNFSSRGLPLLRLPRAPEVYAMNTGDTSDEPDDAHQPTPHSPVSAGGGQSPLAWARPSGGAASLRLRAPASQASPRGTPIQRGSKRHATAPGASPLRPCTKAKPGPASVPGRPSRVYSLG